MMEIQCREPNKIVFRPVFAMSIKQLPAKPKRTKKACLTKRIEQISWSKLDQTKAHLENRFFKLTAANKTILDE